MSEADFRRAFDHALRGHVPFSAYMATMAHAGVPDVHMLIDGRGIWCELKAFDKWPKSPEANVLEHRFTGPQLAFLRRVDRAGGRGLGVVGYKVDGRHWRCVVVRPQAVGVDGVLSRARVERHRPLALNDPFFGARFSELVRRL